MIALAAACAVLGMNAGLLLLGLPMPVIAHRLPELHAPLLVFGFVGALIALERAVALRAAWAYAAPMLLAAGALFCLVPAPIAVGQSLVVIGLGVHLAQYVAIARRQPATATAIQLVAAACGLAAGLVWAGGVAAPRLVPLLAAFLVLTIVGERVELARLEAPGHRAELALFALVLALATACVLTLTSPAVTVPVAGAALLCIVAWLSRFDVARRLVSARGLPRYVAICLLIGYGWLTVAGGGWLLGGALTEGPVYDGVTHAIFLGFVITMIMAHAPIILPAVLQVRLPYHAVLFVPVALLHLSLLTRVVVGDAWGRTGALRAGGVGAAVAMVLFAAAAVAVGQRAARRPHEGRAQHVAS